MKTTYIKPNTDIVVLGVDKAFLGQEDVIGGSPHGKYQDAAEGNIGSFDDDEDWDIPTNTSLWDE